MQEFGKELCFVSSTHAPKLSRGSRTPLDLYKERCFVNQSLLLFFDASDPDKGSGTRNVARSCRYELFEISDVRLLIA